jgi:hypothetical protein
MIKQGEPERKQEKNYRDAKPKNEIGRDKLEMMQGKRSDFNEKIRKPKIVKQ